MKIDTTIIFNCVIFQERAGVKMILIQDASQGPNIDKPLRIIGDPYKVQVHLWNHLIEFKMNLWCWATTFPFSASPGDGAGDFEGERPWRLQWKKWFWLPHGRRHRCKFVSGGRIKSKLSLNQIHMSKCYKCRPLRSRCHDPQLAWSLGAMERWSKKSRTMLELGYNSNKVGVCDDFGCIWYIFGICWCILLHEH